MVEDEAKDRLIQNVRKNLDNEPAVNKQKNAAFQNDNVHIKLDADGNKAKIIKRGQGAVNVNFKFDETNQDTTTLAQY